MATTPTPSLKIKLRLGGLGSSQPSVSSSSSLSGSTPIISSVETIPAATPAIVSLPASLRASSTPIPGMPLNRDEGNSHPTSVSTTTIKKRRSRGKKATAEGRKEAKTTIGDDAKVQTSQGTPSNSRQETPAFDSQPTRGSIAMNLIKNKNMRPRKWRRAFMMITTVGGEMEVPVWRTDDEPRIISLPNSNASAPSNSDGANANVTPSIPAPIVKPPFDPNRPFACPEPNCIKAFPSEDKLASHTVAVHGPKIYGCDMCWKRFGKKEQLARHRKTHMVPLRASSSSAHGKARRAQHTEREDGDGGRDMKDESEADEGDDADS